ncbi:2OG-Fe(II) oxygenase [Saccharobesus litoralis]|uniref:2-oxoglutarate-dependent ethylene/succinate-forming enzyme n=1 Tax=Saccharobesus litoralis TaxID=2172099 RepID=A0A2S0VSR0_9ALTE|nr:2OG-Fe(II) oxygenase family protein [Saccharobesus litoralis]AWB67140.1 2OG-Fe(II) oxygenase [Saccharobesus litoralis]
MQVQVVDYQAADAPQQFTQSLRETGFGVLINHPISQARVAAIYANWQAFFNSNTKQQYSYNPSTYDGFFSTAHAEAAKGSKIADLKEYYHVYPWGRIPPELKDEILEYYRSTSALAAELLAWVEEYSPAEVKANYSEPLPNMIKDTPNTLLRVLHYPPLTSEQFAGMKDNAIRAAAHEDINLLTILPAANEPGLQVKDRQGNWLDVPNDFGSLIINIGDMLQEASNGYYPSTSHRVVNPQGADMSKSRISLPLFLHPRSEVKLSERYTQASYLQERLAELEDKED